MEDKWRSGGVEEWSGGWSEWIGRIQERKGERGGRGQSVSQAAVSWSPGKEECNKEVARGERDR